jgi:hypothetical protein
MDEAEDVKNLRSAIKRYGEVEVHAAEDGTLVVSPLLGDTQERICPICRIRHAGAFLGDPNVS